MTAADSTGTLMVPVANRETADRQMDSAVDIARDRGLSLLVWHVVEVPPQVPLSEGEKVMEGDEHDVVEYAENLGEDAGVDTEGTVQFARDVADGVVGAAEERDVDLILMGWRGRPPRKKVVLGSHLDRVLRDASCDVVVKRIREPTSDLDSLLVSVGEGPHTYLATDTAGSLARRHDAAVELLRVVSPDADDDERDRGRDLLDDAAEALGDVADVETSLVESDHVAGEVTDRSTRHDATFLGSTEKNVVERAFLGDVSDDVGRHAAGAVYIAQRSR